MLMKAQPVYDCWKAVAGEREKLRTIYVTPQGKPLTQKMVKEFASQEELVILCGHYEGIDERVLEEVVTDRVSIGDYVLTGGELPALVMIDAISRLVPGVLGSDESTEDESFEKDLLEYPQYSRPEIWHDKEVPKELLTGDHKKINEWRTRKAEERTRSMRPDMYERYCYRQKIIEELMKRKKENVYMIDALMRDEAEILYAKNSVVVGYHKKTNVAMICCETIEEAKDAAKYLPENYRLLLHNCAESVQFWRDEYGLEIVDTCYQSVYTQHNALPISHKDIRQYPLEELDYANDHYGNGTHKEYLRERILTGEFFAAYDQDKIVGFCGIHSGGSLGLLYVDEEYRRGNIGSSLASFLVNTALDRGGIPYAHIVVGNEASLKMQQKMGLYMANCEIYWMTPKKN